MIQSLDLIHQNGKHYKVCLYPWWAPPFIDPLAVKLLNNRLYIHGQFFLAQNILDQDILA